MQRRETHFEQVPIIEVIETVLREATKLERIPEESPAPVQEQDRQPTGESIKQVAGSPSKVQL